MNHPKPTTMSRSPKRAVAAWRRAYRPTAIGAPTIRARAMASSSTSSELGPEAVSAAATAAAASPARRIARLPIITRRSNTRDGPGTSPAAGGIAVA